MGPMNPMLMAVTRLAARRLTARRALQAASRTAVWVMGALVAAAAAGTVVPLPALSAWTAFAAAAVLATLSAGAVALARRTDPTAAARILDRALHLDERASTAMEVTLGAQPPSPLGARVIVDAASRLGDADLRDAIPLQLPRRAVWIPVLAAVLAIWPALLGGLALPGTPAQRAQQVVRREGARLEQFAQTLQARARAERLPATRRTVPPLRDLGVRLQQERVDRAGALARISELSRQIDAARRQIDQRLEEMGRPQSQATLPAELLRRQAVQRQIRQLQELTSRLRQDSSTVSKDVLDRLGAVTREGEGDQPAQVRRQLQEARRRLEEGDTGGAGESLTQALRVLESMESMLADREGLESARRQLERSRTAIASGSPGARSDEQAASPDQEAQPSAAPGDRPVDAQPGAESPPPPIGPREGSTPGTGRVNEKMGPSSPRLQAERTPQRVRGAQGEGDVNTSEITGAGRPGTAQTQPLPVSAAVLARVDRALERAHIPAQYRLIVLRYFERLAQMK